MNPPYGQRLDQKKGHPLSELYRELGGQLKTHFKGFEAWILVGEETPWREIGLKPTQQLSLRNGPIPCRLIQIPVY